ncbi:hypothetical protein HPG69_004089 [Diceros bicornis minor]|uniref:Uncharacterized protein n=1 Tax=Diceros bicornis minor TaxID=77932 RepID=A0A7J7E9K4_DICBM|nr:hypothetical protein HPG69_004089 [Diceros bicornis minor]
MPLTRLTPSSKGVFTWRFTPIQLFCELDGPAWPKNKETISNEFVGFGYSQKWRCGAPAAALPGSEGATVLPWLQRVELVLFAAAFLCGAVAAAALTRTQGSFSGSCPLCSEAQKIPWSPPGTALQFYSNLHNAETSSWVNLVFWCGALVLQVAQCKSEATPYRHLEGGTLSGALRQMLSLGHASRVREE